MQKRVPGGGPMPRTLWDLLNAFFSVAKKKSEREYIWYLYTRASENASEKNVKFLERGPGGEPLPAAWALKIDGFWKDSCRKEGSIGRVAGTA